MWVFPIDENASEPIWDESLDADKLGAYCVIGVTTKRGDEVIEQYQMHGRIREVSKDGVIFDLEGKYKGHSYNLPADERGFKPAHPGDYRLKSTGETVSDPDFELTWTIDLNPESAN